jgi:hypothetical protein
VRNRKGLAPLTEERILAWADAHHRRTGNWPRVNSGSVEDAPGETWLAVDMALRHGRRGFPGGSSLAWLLAERRGAGEYYRRPPLSETHVLAWADAYHSREGHWPTARTEAIPGADGETWAGVDSALKKGSRGLPGGSSLAQLLDAKRGVRNRVRLPPLTRRQILSWADEHHRRTGEWPSATSGPVVDAPGETWAGVTAALRQGARGLRPGASLPGLLAANRRRRNVHGQQLLSKRKILAWADDHFRRNGAWPNISSGPVAESPGEDWRLIDNALRKGLRGLKGGTSLLRLLERKRGVRNPLALPPLTVQQILKWADAHRERTGRLPHAKAGPIAGAAGETWSTVNDALRRGKRSLAGGSSLAALLRQHGPNQTAKARSHSW